MPKIISKIITLGRLFGKVISSTNPLAEAIQCFFAPESIYQQVREVGKVAKEFPFPKISEEGKVKEIFPEMGIVTPDWNLISNGETYPPETLNELLNSNITELEISAAPKLEDSFNYFHLFRT